MSTGQDLLEMRGISKEFSGVKALAGVSLSLKEGEVLALCGENGAGKSTLMKILSGLYGAGSYRGDILIKGELQRFKNVCESEEAGIAIIYQELSVIPELTIAENVFIGREPTRFGFVDWNKLYAQTKTLCEMLGLRRNPREKIKDLGVGERQLVEIAKALSQNPRILVLDEPTSALSETEIEDLLVVIKKLKSQGVSCILISHKLNEVLEVADRITVLRDGKSISTFEAKEATQQRIVSEMVGRELSDYFPKQKRDMGPVAFELKNFTVPHPSHPDKFLLKDISFSVHEGEILGIAGLMGAGRTELLLSLFGAYKTKPLRGYSVFIGSKKVEISSPHEAIAQGLSLLPEDRKNLGLLLNESVARNLTLSSLTRFSKGGVLDSSLEMAESQVKVEALRVKTASLSIPVKNLSGGNQQKVVLGKCLMTSPRVLFLDEPTRGIDVGAKAEIYRLMNELASQGLAIVMASSELPEILGMSDRVLVMSEGRIVQEYKTLDATQEKIMAAATSVH